MILYFGLIFLILENKMDINITCILSCHNEYENIPILINDILKNKLNNKIKFILVENGSNDGSKELFKNLDNRYENIKFVINENNFGWGNGIKYGLKYTDTEIVGWMHSDLEYDINILDKVLEVININNLSNFDAFLIKGKRIKRPFRKKVLSLGMEILFSIILRHKLHEITSQPVFIKFNQLSKLELPDGLEMDLYLYYMCIKDNCKIFRLNTTQNERKHGSSSWKKNIFSLFSFSFMLLKYALKLKYGKNNRSQDK